MSVPGIIERVFDTAGIPDDRCIKVQFHWDRDRRFDDLSAYWIRVSQGMAGGGYGMMFLPRVGQEVIVDFLEGNPDCPIITGRVYNNDHMPPYDLPATPSGPQYCCSRSAARRCAIVDRSAEQPAACPATASVRSGLVVRFRSTRDAIGKAIIHSSKET